MFHFFAEQGQIEESSITITGADVNHIRNVLRMKEGERALISNRVDRDYLCEIERITTEAVFFRILSAVSDGTELPARIHLFQGLPKSDKMELIIQKAVELGVYQVIPVATKRAVVKLDPKKEAGKISRWNAIAESAAKQSKRIVIPQVTGVMSFKEALKAVKDFDLKLLPYECAEGMDGTKRLLETAGAGMDIGIFIGPEGGFEETEVSLAVEAGVQPITLGRRILRTETAGLCILSVLMFQLES